MYKLNLIYKEINLIFSVHVRPCGGCIDLTLMFMYPCALNPGYSILNIKIKKLFLKQRFHCNNGNWECFYCVRTTETNSSSNQRKLVVVGRAKRRRFVRYH